MRVFGAALLLAVGLAGCAETAPSAVETQESAEKTMDLRNATLEGMPEFCDGPSGCEFWDDHFHEYVVYNLDTVAFDVVIIPPAGLTSPDTIAASRQAVQAWGDGIKELAEPWLNQSFEMNVYAVGVDIPSLDAVTDPDIIVVSTSAAGIIGIGLEPKQFGCRILGEQTLHSYPVHQHGDVMVVAEDCTGVGFLCFAINVGASDTRGLYDLIAHEVGHCLGAGHVGDALDFRSRYAPIDDIMSYQDDPEKVHCVSNLNVRTLEGIYAHLLGQPQDVWLPYGSYYHMPPEDYHQVECSNPPGM